MAAKGGVDKGCAVEKEERKSADQPNAREVAVRHLEVKQGHVAVEEDRIVPECMGLRKAGEALKARARKTDVHST